MRDGLEPSPNHDKFTNALMLGYTPPAPDVLMIREYVGEEGEAGEACKMGDGEEVVGEEEESDEGDKFEQACLLALGE